MTASTPKSEDDLDSNTSAVSEPLSFDNRSLDNRRTAGRGGTPKAKRARGDLQQGATNPATGLPLTFTSPGTVQYQAQNGLLSVLPFNLTGNGTGLPAGGASSVDMSQLAPGTTVIMTSDGQQFLIPVSLGDPTLQNSSNSFKSGSSMASNSSDSAGSDDAGAPILTGPNLTPQQQVMAEEAGRKREVRLLKNREAAKECRRKKKEYIKCLENRVAVLENQNKALIEELKSLKELYCKSTTHD